MSRYPGARGQRRRVAPARRRSTTQQNDEPPDDYQPLLSRSSLQNRHVETGIGSPLSAPSSARERLQAMQVAQSLGNSRSSHGTSSAEELMWASEESSPLLSSQSPPAQSYSPPGLASEPAFLKAKGHLARVHRHHRIPASGRGLRQRHMISPTNQGTVVVRGRNPAPDSSIWICSHGCCCCQCVRTNEVGVLERFGRFETLLGPGQHCMPWPCVRVASRVSMRIQQLNVILETKTVDNVFLHLHVAVLFRVSDVYKANYTLTNARQQIKAYVLDVVRATVPRITVNDVFSQTSDIALSLLRTLQGSMSSYGYEILDALVTKISPNPLIVESMNEINASKRIKDSMPYKAEAFKVKKLKDAEAAAERSQLEGVGVANERKAIVRGMKQSLEETKGQFPAKDVMDMLLLSHYMDTLVAIGGNSMIVQHNPGKLVDLEHQLSSYFTPTNQSDIVEAEPSSQVLNIPDLLW